MLHLLNGDATASVFPPSLPGERAVWRDILVEGPPVDDDAARARWLAPRLGQSPDALHAQMKPQQMERRIQPIEVGRVVAFLLTESANIVRGQSINVDGGDTPY